MASHIEILGIGANGPIYRVQEKEKTYVLKYSSVPSPLTNVPHHPNVVHFLGQAKIKQQWCLLYSDRAGIDLEQLQKRAVLATIDDVIAQSCTGIAHLHQHGIIHRDLKPSNIVITTTGEVFIIDCERSRKKDLHHSRIIGHEPYLAPETQTQGEYSTASDIYALGMIMYSLLDHHETTARKQYSDLAARCVQQSPEDRPSITQVIDSLPQNQASVKHWAQHHIPKLCTQRREYYSSYSLPNDIVLPQIANQKNYPPKWSIFSFVLVFVVVSYSIKLQRTPGDTTYRNQQSYASEQPSTHTKAKTLIQKNKPTIKAPQKIVVPKAPKNAAPPPIDKMVPSATYRISSIPWGAQVWIDDQYIGETLITEVSLSQEVHTITVQYKGKKQQKKLKFDDTHNGYLWSIEENHWKKLYGQ